LIAVSPPLAYYSAARFRLLGALEASAYVYALDVAETARQSPMFWNALAGSVGSVGFDNLQVAAAQPQGTATVERRRVYDSLGSVVIDAPPVRELAWPALAARAPVQNGATRLGEVEVLRSLRSALASTLAVAMASGLLAGSIFTILRVLPLRMLHQALERSAYLSAHDQLTDLPNRRLFADRLTQALAMARRDQDRVAVLCLDLDRFKEVNDTLGHGAGDALLRTVAVRLRAALRESDTLARLGGDEFAVIHPRAREPEDVASLAQRLITALRPSIELDGHLATIGVSIGIALSQPVGSCSAEEMLQDADVALYQAKEAGRGRFCFFAPDMNTRLRERRELESDLRAAVAGEGLYLHYQPQVELATGRLIGAEALLRWNRTGHGMVPPNQFIGLAEETGLIGPIGLWVLREACREATTWPDDIGIAVNASPVQFRLPEFYDDVVGALTETGLAPARLEIEITEGVIMNDTDETLATLGRLRRLGVRLTMDDFGTGYSSLGYLQKFRFDKIKIDRSFVCRLGEDPNAAAIVRAVVGLSDALGVCPNAEGVETVQQADLLRAQGCREVQGYLFGRPMAAASLRAVLTAHPIAA
jgi:diguanylate cyclase (GGDEF)-like protein